MPGVQLRGAVLPLAACAVPAVILVTLATRDERSVVVTATAYNSVSDQTRGNPRVGAWGDLLGPDTRAIAVSRDLLRLGLRHGTRVRVDGLEGDYLVLDKMARRWKRRIDIYMGKDIEAARAFGVRRVRIHWTPAD
jgi:3D (Asp-Asp-Asp) domain-containing protein